MLSKSAQISLMWLDLIHWESGKRNPLEISQRNLSEWAGYGLSTAQKVLTELDDLGFICRERAGSLRGPHTGRTAVYRLTWRHSNEGLPPTKDYRNLKP